MELGRPKKVKQYQDWHKLNITDAFCDDSTSLNVNIYVYI